MPAKEGRTPAAFTNPGAPDLGTGILKTPIGDQGGIINAAENEDQPEASATEGGTDNLPGSVTGSNGETIPLPVVGSGTPVNSGKGMAYDIPAGTEGLNSRVVKVRVMDPVNTGKSQYPNGYVVYMNQAGRSVNPLTGQTVGKADPYNHIPLP